MNYIATRAREASLAGDDDALLELLSLRPIQLWFSVPPPELSFMLGAVAEEKLHRSLEATLVLHLLSMGEGGLSSSQLSAVRELLPLERHRHWIGLIEGAQARLVGDVGHAYGILSELPDVRDSSPTVLDPTHGARAFAIEQAAMTAALAGRFQDALALYTRLLRVPPSEGVEFFTREANLRAAMIHGLYGDASVARSHLAEARRVPRSTSWAEMQLDSEQSLVEALLSDGDPDGAFDAAMTLTYGQMGEMWPFYLLALQRTGIIAGRGGELCERIRTLLASGLGDGGTGLPGSVPQTILALDALMCGNVAGARREQGNPDDQMWPSRITQCLVAIASGASQAAIRLLRDARSMTAHLTQAERHRLLVLALAYQTVEDEAALSSIVEVLAGTDQTLGAFDLAVMEAFAPRLLAFVGQCGPDLLPAGMRIRAEGGIDVPNLSASELEILERLARGLTREQIARELFRSPNTIKTHQRSLYRKLGAKSAREAVVRAIEAGYIWGPGVGGSS
ncbi:putative transcriptional regulatory protein NarL [Microbacterium azadirachtae]|uniref:Putative transcriptional regulatory protein NarL n=2 Tax=Microbacterium azadirachtae TaxID=582680 RepID=A0A0F0LML3_9MICO|nr:putative transcriptional regulatory protein NarL [Microbacterium azadirachtae]